MIKKSSNIDERKLTKFMGKGYDIVNIQEEGFQYCNGYILVNCTYENDLVIQKLFNIGAIKNYKNWTPKITRDMAEAIKCVREVDAEKTHFLYESPNNKEFAYAVKVEDKYFYYNKKYVDIFANVTFKAGIKADTDIPLLKAYDGDKLIGLVLAVRINDDRLLDIIG